MIVFDPKFVWTQHLLDTDFFDLPLFGANIYDPPFFDPENLWLKVFLDPFFSELTICGPNSFVNQ